MSDRIAPSMYEWSQPVLTIPLTLSSDAAKEENRAESEDDARMQPIFSELMDEFRSPLASAVRELARQVCEVGGPVRILSVMRAGLPIGLAVTKVASLNGRDLQHGLLGFVRGGSEDLESVSEYVGTTVVVDGWTGSGSTLHEIRRRWRGGQLFIAAVADPGNFCDIAGTHEDLMCPHAVLQRTMSLGLGRLHVNSEGHAVTTLTESDPSMLSEYVAQLVSDQTTSGPVAQESELSALELATAPSTFREQSNGRLGINECWRAFARGELRALIVDDKANESKSVTMLLAIAGLPVLNADIGTYACVGVV